MNLRGVPPTALLPLDKNVYKNDSWGPTGPYFKNIQRNER